MWSKFPDISLTVEGKMWGEKPMKQETDLIVNENQVCSCIHPYTFSKQYYSYTFFKNKVISINSNPHVYLLSTIFSGV